MTREDVLKLFPDATDEQITNLLNQNNSEVAREKNKAGKDKEELARLCYFFDLRDFLMR